MMRAFGLLLFCSISLIVVVAQRSVQQPSVRQSSPAGPEAGVAELQKEAEAGDAAAANALAKAYEQGKGVRLDVQKSLTWYRKAAELGNPDAQNTLGVIYWAGELVDKDKKQALTWYQKAARQGNATAMFNLGAAYYNGDIVQHDEIRALGWFLLAEEAGSSSGKDAAQRTMSEHKSSGFEDACVTVGEMYDKGEELPRNVDLASKWYSKAADRGSNPAKLKLAMLAYAAQNYGVTRRWCEEAAQARSRGGQFCLALLYKDGLGVQRDEKKAFNLMLEAARNAYHPAARPLAEMYANGTGTKINRMEAFLWFVSAAQRGDKNAAEEARALHSTMDPKEWKRIEKKLRQERAIDMDWLNQMLQGSRTATP